jgi:hypothetical protein
VDSDESNTSSASTHVEVKLLMIPVTVKKQQMTFNPTIITSSPKENCCPSALELNIRHDFPPLHWWHSLPTLFQTCPHASKGSTLSPVWR